MSLDDDAQAASQDVSADVWRPRGFKWPCARLPMEGALTGTTRRYNNFINKSTVSN
jgi:hypothetical protein